MAYEKTEWENGQGAPINADNLNKIEQGIEDAHGDIAELTHEVGELETDFKSNIAFKKWIPYECTSVAIPANSYVDVDVPCEQGKFHPYAVAGIKINNSASNGQNGAWVVCSWAMLINSTTLRIRFRNLASNVAVIQAQVSLLYLKETPRSL